MINLLDMMMPKRSGSHRSVRAPGGVTYQAVTSDNAKKREQNASVCVRFQAEVDSFFVIPFFKT